MMPGATSDLFGEECRSSGSFADARTRFGSHDQWLTPLSLVEALGPFDLDPCAPRECPTRLAAHGFTVEDDGLRRDWTGRVWLNPPYSEAGAWVKRLASHGDGVALLFARTDTALWHDVIWPGADAIMFLRGRLRFELVNGKVSNRSTATAPSALVGFGEGAARSFVQSGLPGAIVDGVWSR